MAIPIPKLEIAFATANPLTQAPAFTDVTSYLMEATVSRGRQRELDRCDTGQGSFLLDGLDWSFVPGYPSSQFFPNVLPAKFIRLSATLSGTTYRLFTGYIDGWEVNWAGPIDSTVRVQASDALSLLAMLPIAGPFSQKTVGLRIADLLTTGGWPAGNMNLANGNVTCIQKTYATTDNMTVLTAVNQTADTDPGTLFVDGAGNVVYVAGFSSGPMPFQLGDDPTRNEVPFEEATLSLRSDTVYNDIRGSRDGGAGQQASVTSDSKTEFSPRLLTKQTYNQNDPQLLATMGRFSSRYKYPTQLFDPVTVMPVNDSNAYAFCLAAEIGRTVTASRTPPPSSGLPRFSQLCVVNHFQHEIKAGVGADWKTTLRLAGASLH